ncbi:MAG: hypothetical protein KDB14_19465 [Planctomycetales bacterium]|nr:hypothetical protein [Planctomycetales bacterium]
MDKDMELALKVYAGVQLGAHLVLGACIGDSFTDEQYAAIDKLLHAVANGTETLPISSTAFGQQFPSMTDKQKRMYFGRHNDKSKRALDGCYREIAKLAIWWNDNAHG